MDFVITVRNGGTLYGCYKQALREVHKRWRLLAEMSSTPADDCTVARDAKREFLRFYGQAIAIRRLFGLKDDESMPDDLRERLDVEMWEHRIRSMAAIDFLSCDRLQRQTIEMLQCCPVEMRRRLAAEITDPANHQRLVDWWMDFDPCLPAPLVIPETEARRLLSCVSQRSYEPRGIGAEEGWQSRTGKSSGPDSNPANPADGEQGSTAQ
jgi:hypothetical protein